MKIRILSIIFAFVASISLWAQTTKKVAILDLINRDDNISYATRLMVRSTLGEVVTNTPGYEAYERSDVDAIMSEQNFQRTGLVSDEQIRRLGEISGVTYIIVGEVVNAGNHTLFISAKVLNVETAKTISSATATCSDQPASIQTACRNIVEKLLGVKDVEKGIIQSGWQQEGYDSNYLSKVGGGKYKYGEVVLQKKAYENFLRNNCPDAWKKYKHGKNAVIAGWTVFGVGGVLLTGWWTALLQGWSTHAVGYPMIGGSAAICGIGIASFSVGYGLKNNAYITYNKNCANKQPQLSINFQGSENGIGIALGF